MSNHRASTASTLAPSIAALKTGAENAVSAFRFGDVKLFELLIGASIAFWRYPIGGIPGEILVICAVITVGMFRRAKGTSGNTLLVLGALYFAMIAFVVAVSILEGASWQQRTLRLALLALFALTIAGGRLDWRSIVVGAAVGLAINVGAFYAGLTPNKYPPFLTGWLMDKNVAGLYYATVGMLLLGVVRRYLLIVIVLATAFAFLWLTGSRTSLAAFVLAIGWWLMRNRAPLLLRLGAFLIGVRLLEWFEETFSQTGAFADREGTDILRESIHAAERAKVTLTPWHGQGLNSAWVDIPNFPHMWFHDSYASLFVEGGYPMLWTMLALVGIAGLGLLSRRRVVSDGLRAAEGALIVALVAAWQLGEVFFTAAVFFALGIAWYERFTAPTERSADLAE
ncbi:zinc ABC transporter permease [Microbacterium esteraromaticum]|uniref:Zinc ABC transporter permease n=1 Tax=Microbacterium esteraromaticum TaxID=57043 RepID=A0A7D8ACU0_9MICO|nr:zinc ABC transporter permease [Microbacterium esteraromaticum]QMU97384.1 zinc ABC transporter permease [Microbacterium esteraromaticum]